MKYVDEFRNKSLITKIARNIRNITPPQMINIMEVCGTHTQNFFRFGLNTLLPQNIRLISGPGCPVCVSAQGYIDQAIQYAGQRDKIIATFGDLLRVPGTYSSLEKEQSRLGNVRVVYSPLDSLKIAKGNPNQKVIFLAVGFETTAPAVALTILLAKKEKIKNLFFLIALKLMPPAMRYLVQDPKLAIHGFLCPGHVSSIIGTKPYEFIPAKYGLGCCVAGFEPLDMLEGIYFLIRQIVGGAPIVENQYIRAVKKAGNPEARKIMSRVFKTSDAYWRGLGEIPQSGLFIRREFSLLDAEKALKLKTKKYKASPRQKKCRCAEVLKGRINPDACPLFAKLCNPDNPIGPCMVSGEGACNAYYRYK